MTGVWGANLRQGRKTQHLRADASVSVLRANPRLSHRLYAPNRLSALCFFVLPHIEISTWLLRRKRKLPPSDPRPLAAVEILCCPDLFSPPPTCSSILFQNIPSSCSPCVSTRSFWITTHRLPSLLLVPGLRNRGCLRQTLREPTLPPSSVPLHTTTKFLTRTFRF